MLLHEGENLVLLTLFAEDGQEQVNAGGTPETKPVGEPVGESVVVGVGGGGAPASSSAATAGPTAGPGVRDRPAGIRCVPVRYPILVINLKNGKYSTLYRLYKACTVFRVYPKSMDFGFF
jgi:hypothetical protein